MTWLATIVVSIAEWLLENGWKKFWSWRAAVNQEKADAAQAKISSDQFAIDKAKATTPEESADAGKKLLNS